MEAPVGSPGRQTTPKPDRAQPPRAPQLPASAQRSLEEAAIYRREREGVERQSVLRGLLLLAILVLVAGLLHGGLSRAFFSGWWRHW
jgi:hypothetical protein